MGNFSDAVLPQYAFGFGKRRALRCGYKIALGHHFFYKGVALPYKILQVAVGDYALKYAVFVNDGQTAYLVACQQFFRMCYCGVGLQRYRVGNHSAFVAFYLVYLRGLTFDGHIFVNETDAALSCKCDCHFRFGYGVHCRRDNRYVKRDCRGKICFQTDVCRKYVRVLRNK